MKTHFNNGHANTNSAAANLVLDSDAAANFVSPAGVHAIKKPLTSGMVAIYLRHRKTNTKLPGVPGGADFEALRQQLDVQVGKPRITRNTLAGLREAHVISPEYDTKVTSDSQRRNNARVFKAFLAATALDADGKSLGTFGELPATKDALLSDSFYNAVMTYQSQLVAARKAIGKNMREVDAHMTAIYALLNWATEKRKVPGLPSNPLGKYTKLYKSGRNDAIFTDQQIAAWLREAGKDNYKGRDLQLVFLLAITIGQRASDLRYLQWSDYTVINGRRGFAVYPLKTQGHEGNRKVFVPVLDWVGDILDGMRGAPHEKVLTLRGKAWTGRTLSYYFGNVTRAAMVEGQDEPGLVATVEGKNAKGQRVFKHFALHMHDLRGTAITKMAEAGCRDRQIAAITGHSVEHVSRILDQYAANTAELAIGAIDRLATTPSMQKLKQHLSHLAPVAPLPQLTHRPELPELGVVRLQAAE